MPVLPGVATNRSHDMNGIRIPNDWRWGRVREDVDAGRLWKARDRLQGCLRAEPANQDVLDMLGAVWFEMGDLPQAGRHWWLTERDDEKAATARTAFYERFGHRAHEVLRSLPRPARPEHYPVAVRGRLEELVTAAKADGLDWQPSDWKPTPSEWESEGYGEPYTRSIRDRVTEIAVIGGFLGVLLVGLATVVAWVVSMIASVVD